MPESSLNYISHFTVAIPDEKSYVNIQIQIDFGLKLLISKFVDILWLMYTFRYDFLSVTYHTLYVFIKYDDINDTL